MPRPRWLETSCSCEAISRCTVLEKAFDYGTPCPPQPQVSPGSRVSPEFANLNSSQSPVKLRMLLSGRRFQPFSRRRRHETSTSASTIVSPLASPLAVISTHVFVSAILGDEHNVILALPSDVRQRFNVFHTLFLLVQRGLWRTSVFYSPRNGGAFQGRRPWV